MTALVFYRRFNSRRESVGVVEVEAAAGVGVVEYVVAAEQVAGVALSRRSSSTGVFEVQAPDGIWSAEDGGSLTRWSERTGCVAREAATFRTWEELEAEEYNEMRKSQNELSLPALEVTQGPGRVLYLSSVDGKQVHNFATISRLQRQGGTELVGYQRPEVLRHILQIRDYVESPGAMVPNAVVLAFDKRVSFHADSKQGNVRVGSLRIPLPPEGAEPHTFPGFIVDGQQRLAAIRDAQVESFPVAFTAFIAATTEEQTEQFILVNSTKPLPAGLITELLPSTRAQLPEKYRRKRLPATLLERLNLDADSPLKGLIITQTNPKATGSAKKAAAWGCSGLLKDTSLLNTLESSLSDGALYNYMDRETKAPDVEGMVRLLCAYWGAVQDAFPKAWAKPMDESRLFHGASVVALGFLMDAVCDRLQTHFDVAEPTREQFAAELSHVSGECHWTEGRWDFSRTLQRRWNDIQNTGKDRTILSDYLRTTYLMKAGGRPPVGQK